MQNVRRKEIVRKNRATYLDFYNTPIGPNTDLIHAEFMDRRRMIVLLNRHDDKKVSDDIRTHLEKHDIESTKKRLAEYKSVLNSIED